MDQQVINLFHESIEAKMQSGESLAPKIAHASEVLVEALLNERKILTCGNGVGAAQAQILTACLLNRFEQERPRDRKSTRLNSSHVAISYAVFCLKKKTSTYNNSQSDGK